MSNRKIALLLAAFVLLIVAAYLFLPKSQPDAAKPLISTQESEPGGRGQCLGKQCYTSPPNLECILVGDGCETRVMGGAQQEYTPETKANDGDYAIFFLQRVLKLNIAMQSAGVEIGDTITRVNGVYAGSDLEFSKLVLSLPKGTRLSLWTNKGESKEVTL